MPNRPDLPAVSVCGIEDCRFSPAGPRLPIARRSQPGNECALRGPVHRQIGVDRHCCRTLTSEDSHRESMRLDGRHEQADARPLPHDELVQLHCFTSHTRVAADLAGQGDDLVAQHDGRPGRPAVFSDTAIQFCLTIKVLFKLPLRQIEP